MFECLLAMCAGPMRPLAVPYSCASPLPPYTPPPIYMGPDGRTRPLLLMLTLALHLSPLTDADPALPFGRHSERVLHRMFDTLCVEKCYSTICSSGEAP